ncbi:3454_t:CDS:2 [Paraglomus brasilianum]|uniref:3454_t:CDS:1 n=1 Tax=Paraglomus brasilianum TaxID=144538 RepID=A0A9N9CNV8_9GLOM|nr:3454_t:CDS:2 [Paraglomus brasilianum]
MFADGTKLNQRIFLKKQEKISARDDTIWLQRTKDVSKRDLLVLDSQWDVFLNL